MILDGYGLNDRHDGNAVYEAKTPVMDGLMKDYPFVKGNASGLAVGLPDGQMGKQVKMLKHHAHFFPHRIELFVRHSGQILSLEQNLSGSGLFQTVQTAQKGTLARTGRSDDDDLFTLFNGRCDALQNVQVAEGLLQIFNLDHFLPISFPASIPANSGSLPSPDRSLPPQSAAEMPHRSGFG